MKYRHYTPNADVVVVEMEDIDPKRGCTSSLGVSQQRLKVKQEVVHSLALYPEAVIGILRTGAPVEAVDICDGAIELHLGASAEDIARNLFKGLRDLELSRCRIIIIEGGIG
ncbi:hypothetical protein BASA81_009166 [Batrachochytrium salamandrivorans]|nr:hypothetical protein BASA81_009166 [Batrachochytrium salamandrivorans]